MSKGTYISSDKKSQQQDSRDFEGRFVAHNRDRLSANSWQAAIDFAVERMDQLKTLVKIFGEYRDSGAPFPGEAKAARRSKRAVKILSPSHERDHNHRINKIDRIRRR